MSHTANAATPAVSQDEMARRLAEYRLKGFQSQAMPHIVYHGTQLLCPCPGCGYQIAGIDFQLENLNDKKNGDRTPKMQEPCPRFFYPAWWQGPGLVGRCPGCRQNVLYGMSGKQAVPDPAAAGFVVLPDDWHQTAYLL